MARCWRGGLYADMWRRQQEARGTANARSRCPSRSRSAPKGICVSATARAAAVRAPAAAGLRGLRGRSGCRRARPCRCAVGAQAARNNRGRRLGRGRFGHRLAHSAACGRARCRSSVGAVAAGSAESPVAYTLTDSVLIWFILTLLHGVVSEIWMNVVVEEKRRGHVMAVYSMLVALGLALGPFVLQIISIKRPSRIHHLHHVLVLWWRCRCCPTGRPRRRIERAEDSGSSARSGPGAGSRC